MSAGFRLAGERGSLPMVLAKARTIALAGGVAQVSGPDGAVVTVAHHDGGFEVETATLFEPSWLPRARAILAEHG
jgi:hypothetical protein